MVRFIVKYKQGDNIAGYNSEGFSTILLDVPELERILSGGGSGEAGYDIRELFGCEIVPKENNIE